MSVRRGEAALVRPRLLSQDQATAGPFPRRPGRKDGHDANDRRRAAPRAARPARSRLLQRSVSRLCRDPRASPVFFWEDYGFWCFARHADVSALLRDRRFGRQMMHVMSRARARLARAEAASCAVRRARAPFDAGARAARAHAPAQPRQSRLRVAPDRKARARGSRPWRTSGSTGSPAAGAAELIEEFADADSRRRHRRAARRAARDGAAARRLVAPDGRHVPVRRQPRGRGAAAEAARAFADSVRDFRAGAARRSWRRSDQPASRRRGDGDG